jgi:hypothetical protein
MKLQGVRAIASALGVVLAGPSPSPETVGIAWYRKATVGEADRQRLADDIRDVLELDADAVVSDAVSEARRVVSLELPVEAIDELVDVERRMQRGSLRFRVGEFDAAEAEAELVIDAIRQRPALPGAVSLLWRAHLLRARVAWTRADDAGVEAALRAAVALDPRARLSTRRVPPDFVAVYDRIARGVERSEWVTVELGDRTEDAAVELDGQPGLRAVPPGQHVVVVRRPGHRAVEIGRAHV